MKINDKKSNKFINNPARVITIGFAITIIIGSILLSLPFCSKNNTYTNFSDSLFIATSATCVTGLSIFDTFSQWSYIGQSAILFLIQIGGLGIVTLTTFFNIAIGKKLGLKSMQLAKESISSDNTFDSSNLVKMVIFLSLIFEIIGAIILSFAFVPKFGRHGFFLSIFTSISAYCNAGFDIFGFLSPYSSLTFFYDNPLVLYTIMALIICGGLGFLVWYDLYNYKKTKKLLLHTKIVIVVTISLILIGTISFLILEWNNTDTIGNMTFEQKINNSLFHSVTTRTAGFNSIDISNLTDMSKILSIILMFIGAAPGSTGGGIKTTTIAVLFMTVISLIKGKEDTIILGRKVTKNTVYKALSVAFIGFVSIFLTTIMLYFTAPIANNNMSGIDALFESVSAFATVGLSTGITSIANVSSKIVIILVMFLGRVGPVSFALSLSVKNNVKKDKHRIIPEGKVIVG